MSLEVQLQPTSSECLIHFPYPRTSILRVAFATPEHAAITKAALEVDEEIQPTRISKEISVEGNYLVVYFSATEDKLLRVAMSSFFDMVIICTKTLLEFGDDGQVANSEMSIDS